MIRPLAAAAAALAALVLASCGDDEDRKSATPADKGAIELTVRSDAGAKGVSTGTLTCDSGEQRVTGALVKRAPVTRLCTAARALASLLEAKEPARRVCTRIYGGPQTARITGSIDGRGVDRTFKRTNGCEIEEYARVSKILPL